MRSSFLLALLYSFLLSSAQDLTGFEKVNQFKINGLATTVYFKDPLRSLFSQHPDFDSKENQAKHELLDAYLHHNTLYVFQTSNKSGVQKNYELKGNPQKVRTKFYFDLAVSSPTGAIEKTTNKVNTGGSFFEHMAIFQTPQAKEVIGKGVQIWGNFVLVEPYAKLKAVVSELIKMDIENTLPADWLAREEKRIEPLFRYQTCGLQTVKRRTFTITVYQYDSLGKVANQYPRTEKDEDLYASSISEDLIGVTTFPFFSATDKKETEGNVIQLTSGLTNINHYLKDIKITLRPNTEDVEKIEATLIIHSYSAQGHSTFDERYLALFEKVGDCWLPKTIKLSPLSDPTFQRPRLVADIEYELN